MNIVSVERAARNIEALRSFLLELGTLTEEQLEDPSRYLDELMDFVTYESSFADELLPMVPGTNDIDLDALEVGDDDIQVFRLSNPEQVAEIHGSLEESLAENSKSVLRYRKKPVVVDAFKMDWRERENLNAWPEWLIKSLKLDPQEPNALYDGVLGVFKINTLEGVHLVNWGDWIIKGVKGELYPCKPDIFEMTYEAIHEVE